ncbi:MAG: replication initiator protein A [Pirellulaceae bacterium]|nr:replication initiator protein A [Pirellulaceae bacterium]
MKQIIERDKNAIVENDPWMLHAAVDELNLAEFPLASIADRHLDGRKTLVFEEPIYDRNERKYVQRRLTVSGSDRFGLPTAIDDDVLLACIQLSKLEDFRSPEVRFSRYELLKLLRLPTDSKNYARIATSLRRWKGLTIFSDRAFYDHENKSWVNRDFGIFDSLYVYRRERPQGGVVPSNSRFTWNDVIFRSFQAGYLKRFDWQLYTSLESSIAKRLYRFLDKRFYHSPSFEMDLRDLAINRVGLSATQNVAQLKRGLLKGITELERRWDLRSIPNEKRFVRQARGQWMIRFERKRRSKTTDPDHQATKAPLLLPSIDPTQLATALTKRCIGPASAEELSQNYPAQSIQSMIELFDWYNARGQSRGPGFLVQSIKNPKAIEFPPGFESSHQIHKRRTANDQRTSEHHKQASQRERIAVEQEASRLSAFHAYWQSLSSVGQLSFEEAAVDQTDHTKRTGYYRYQGREDKLFEPYRQVILRDHFERTHDRDGLQCKTASSPSQSK